MAKKEITGSQSITITYGTGELSRDLANFGTYTEYRAMRKDATIALGRGLLVSGVCSGAWSVEGDKGVSDKWVDLITSLLPLRDEVMGTVVALGRVDFGWMPFEKIFATRNGRMVLEKLKPLLHDITVVLIDEHGSFKGYRQKTSGGITVDIPAEKCLHVAFDVEGQNYYGNPLLENIRSVQSSWDDCNAGAKRYDLKIAGSHFVVHYPPGTGELEGESVDNSVIAKAMIVALEASGSMAMPSTTAEVIQELTDANVAKLYQWDVTLLSDASPRQPTFIERLKYLDTLKIRGLILPERSMLEGTYGTKAEAETHVGLAITGMQEIDQHITRELNTQLVDPLLTANFGAEAKGTVRLVAAPLVDLEQEFLRKLYLALLPNESDTVDTRALKEQLSIPIKEPENVQ